MAGKPADLDHPYGHGRIEYLSGLFIAAAILMTGGGIDEIFRWKKILHPEAPDFSVISIIIFDCFDFIKNVDGPIQSEAREADSI